MQPVSERMQFTHRFFVPRKTRAFLFADNAVRLTVGCGAVSGECSSLRRFRVRGKTEFRDLVNSTLLLNRKELEDVFYMKMERLDDTNPTAYQLHQWTNESKNFTRKCPLPKRGQHTVF